MKNVCVITAARSEYGLLRWIIDEIQQDELLTLQLIVTGSHLSPEYGDTYREIEQDGYRIDAKIEMLLSTSTAVGIAKSMGVCMISIADTFYSLKPDLLVVLGDRYELLSICSTALVMNIPIAHISGGDVTEGAIDDQIRNAITMMATLHFPGVSASADNIARMRGTNVNIFTVGEPGLDNFNRLQLWSRDILASNLNIDIRKRWLLITYHPETNISLGENLQVVAEIIELVCGLDNTEIVVTKANTDLGGAQINAFLETQAKIRGFKLYESLGQLRYLSFMKEAFCVIGNSSSGIIEAPYLGKPVINIGNRQCGRHLCANVFSSLGDIDSINNALNIVMKNDRDYVSDFYYGKGNSSIKIKEGIKDYLLV